VGVLYEDPACSSFSTTFANNVGAVQLLAEVFGLGCGDTISAIVSGTTTNQYNWGAGLLCPNMTTGLSGGTRRSLLASVQSRSLAAAADEPPMTVAAVPPVGACGVAVQAVAAAPRMGGWNSSTCGFMAHFASQMYLDLFSSYAYGEAYYDA
jgi:hypothetical protein